MTGIPGGDWILGRLLNSCHEVLSQDLSNKKKGLDEGTRNTQADKQDSWVVQIKKKKLIFPPTGFNKKSYPRPKFG